MKYIYYIVGIMVAFSALAAYGLFGGHVEISRPFLSVNDRTISEAEFESMLRRKPDHMNMEQFVDSVIEKQLLIQEAIRLEINKEETFRNSVENFYEQSLIKILLDRKLEALEVAATQDEIRKYQELSRARIFLTRFIYPTIQDAREKTNETIQAMASDFVDLSDDVKFIVLNLDPGKVSKPVKKGMEGILVYRLDDIREMDEGAVETIEDYDLKAIEMFIRDQKKEALLDEWMDSIRESAVIWREK